MTEEKQNGFDLKTAPLAGRYIIEAGAGTGKTYSLEHLVLRLLIETKATIDRILIVTFTKSATAEIAERVRGMLERISTVLAGDGRFDDEVEASLYETWTQQNLEVGRRVEAALEGFDDACIFTIHSFCQKMLSEFVFTRGGSFEVDYAAGNRDLIDRVVDEFVRQQLGRLCPETAARLAGSVGALGEILGKLSSSGPTARTEYFAPVDPTEDPEGARLQDIFKEFVRVAPERLRRLQREAGVGGFDSLLVDMHTLCREDPQLVERVRERFDAVLIDEFQDTDPLQYDIFKRLFLAEDDDNGPKSVFFVGDPKQAIYAFRAAELSTYLFARKEMAARDPKSVLALKTNYRSAPALVSFVNRYFSDDEKKKHFLHEELDFEHSESGSAALPLVVVENDVVRPIPAVSVWLREPSDEVVSTDAARRMEIEWIAADISRLLSQEVWVCKAPGKDGQLRPARRLRPGDIAVLMRKRAQASALIEKLAFYGVRAALTGAGSVFGTEEAAHIRAVLEALAAPDDRLAVNTARATPVWGRRLSELRDEAEECGVKDRGILTDAVQSWTRSGPAGAFAVIFERTQTAPRVLKTRGGEQMLQNYAHLIERLQAQFARLRTAQVMLRWLDAKMADSKNEPEEDKIRALMNEDVVSLQTIHTSKGLEFPVVYAAFSEQIRTKTDTKMYCLRKPATVADGAERLYCIGHEQIKVRDVPEYLVQETQENVRLAYVALTRASSHLVLSWLLPSPMSNGAGRATWKNGYMQALMGDDDPVGQNKTYELFFSALQERLNEVRDAMAEDSKKCARDAASLYGTECRTFDQAPFDAPETLLEIRTQCPQGKRLLVGGTDKDLPTASERCPLSHAWRRTSFTSLSKLLAGGYGQAGSASEEEFENDEAEDEVIGVGVTARIESDADRQSTLLPNQDSGELMLDPLAKIRGRTFGTWLHTVFERVFRDPCNCETVLEGLSESLAGESFMRNLSDDARVAVADRLRAMVQAVRSAPLFDVCPDEAEDADFRKPIASFALSDLTKGLCLSEMPFLMSVSDAKARINDIVRVMQKAGHPMQESESMALEGFMTGSIDLVFAADDRYWIIDWKSNRIGRGEVGDYTPEAMRREIDEKHYALQYVIYLLALKRHLKVMLHLDDAQVWRKIGGVFYVFVRGVEPGGAPGHGIYFDRPRWAVDALDALLTSSQTGGN